MVKSVRILNLVKTIYSSTPHEGIPTQKYYLLKETPRMYLQLALDQLTTNNETFPQTWP